MFWSTSRSRSVKTWRTRSRCNRWICEFRIVSCLSGCLFPWTLDNCPRIIASVPEQVVFLLPSIAKLETLGRPVSKVTSELGFSSFLSSINNSVIFRARYNSQDTLCAKSRCPLDNTSFSISFSRSKGCTLSIGMPIPRSSGDIDQYLTIKSV